MRFSRIRPRRGAAPWRTATETAAARTARRSEM